MIVPIVASSIAASGSWRTAVAAIGAAASAVIVPFALPTVREPDAPLAGLETPAIDPAPAPGPDLDLLGALRTRTFWVLAFALWSFYLYYLAVTFHLVPFLSDLGFSDARAAASLSGAVGLGVLSKLGMGLVADRISERTALRANFAVIAVASLLLLGVARPSLLVAFLVAHGFAVAAENVVLPLVVAQSFGVRHLASIYGALMVTLFLGGAPGPWFAGRIFDATGDYRPAFAVFAVLNVLGWLSLYGVRLEAGRARPTGATATLAVSD
jgi:predicted MFS family arabinose efflux permease